MLRLISKRVYGARTFTTFSDRHIGISHNKVSKLINYKSTNDLLKDTIPKNVIYSDINPKTNFKKVPQTGLSETEALESLKQIGQKNSPHIKSFIGQGYYNCITPPVILRNLIENPSWYTPYTPYQAEIAQGRLESLFNYQTMISDLTGLPRSNASLLDEASAAAEAMTVSYFKSQKYLKQNRRFIYFVDKNVHPQTIEVLKGRADALGGLIYIDDVFDIDFTNFLFNGVLIQYPDTLGNIQDADMLKKIISQIKDLETRPLVTVATDLLALTILTSPGELGADIALGNTQRFGVPIGCGGPHAAFFATTEENLRLMPGRMIGMTEDSQNNPAFRMALQTREQHIKREKATSNICTAQALLANVAVNYAIYHGPKGLKKIAEGIHEKCQALLIKYKLDGITSLNLVNSCFFDTLTFSTKKDKNRTAKDYLNHALDYDINLRLIDDDHFSIALDETTTTKDIQKLVQILNCSDPNDNSELDTTELGLRPSIPMSSMRTSKFLEHEVFNSYHTETEMMRFLYRLERKDLGLNTSMIPLGSCTMKLNSVSEMIPITWPEFANIHPYAPSEQRAGYKELTTELRSWLSEITGFADVFMQPNSGALGEYTGLRLIAQYHLSNLESNVVRNICLIPDSAHGTNPASAVLAGYKVVLVKSDNFGNIDLNDLSQKISKHKDHLGALMVTYPNTYGVFENSIKQICEMIHEAGGQVYMDGANMNAQVGLTNPGMIGADVCHLNLHKTFCIPHGGGGPGSGPIGIAKHLVPYLAELAPVLGSEWGNPMVLPISYQYIKMMGAIGLTDATKAAIVNANYMMEKLCKYYEILYTNENGRCAHEFILDVRSFKKTAKITAIDIAKRLQDYGFHAPTMSWPVANTIMIEPTESESKEEIDRYCEALIQIRNEINEIELQIKEGNTKIIEDNLLINAPHTIDMISKTSWTHPYSRESAVFPLPYLKKSKHWPTVGRTNEIYGDRNLITRW